MENNFIAHGSYTVSNTGGYFVQISSTGDEARLKDTDGNITDWFEIEYVEGDEDEVEPIIDPTGYNVPLNQVMRLNEF